MEDLSEDILDKIEQKILEDPFVLKNLNYTHYYFHDPDNYTGGIISTSIRIYPNGNRWSKRVVTKFIDSNYVEKEISYERDIDDTLASKIENNVDLRKLSNNYTNEKLSGTDEKFELIYNNIYKIMGTLDAHIKEIDYVKDMLLVSDILEDEKKKVSDIL